MTPTDPSWLNNSRPSCKRYDCGFTKPDKDSRSKRDTRTFLLVEPPKSPISVLFFQTISRILYHWHDALRCINIGGGGFVSRFLSNRKGACGHYDRSLLA